MVRRVETTRVFEKDFKREKKGVLGPKLDGLIKDIVDDLAADLPLAFSKRDHALHGDWIDHRDGVFDNDANLGSATHSRTV